MPVEVHLKKSLIPDSRANEPTISGCATHAVVRTLSLGPPSRPRPTASRGGESPQVLRFEAAARSNDLRLRTIAKILDLLCALVTIDVALFYTVNERLEKYASEPIVAKINQQRSVDLDQMLRAYREHCAEYDLFAPSRVARTRITVLGSQDVGGEMFRRSRYAAAAAAKFSLLPVAEVYLRAGGKIAAAISLLRDPSAPELTPSEIYMLRKLHGLCEHAYRLAGPSSWHGANVLQAEGLTPRQREVVMLAVRGTSSSEIAATLRISHSTVKTHLKHAFKKLGVLNRHQALLLLMNATPAPEDPGDPSMS